MPRTKELRKLWAGLDASVPAKTSRRSCSTAGATRANSLAGKEWTRNSISIWSDVRKDAEELSLRHPAIFPKSLVNRCLECFTRDDQTEVLDPFSGSGSTLIAAAMAGKNGVGFEINPDYVESTYRRYERCSRLLFTDVSVGSIHVFPKDARTMGEYVQPDSIDICVTSPPYWNVLTQKRSADNKPVRNYGQSKHDLGRVIDYVQFLDELGKVFTHVATALKPRAYCLINVMDLRKGPVFYPFHSDLANVLLRVGFRWDDLIIWDRRSEYNNMRPLGYPAVFRINKAHEFILVMQKPG